MERLSFDVRPRDLFRFERVVRALALFDEDGGGQLCDHDAESRLAPRLGPGSTWVGFLGAQPGKRAMIEEPAAARRGRGQGLVEVTKEDLDPYSVEELEERIALLSGEIERVRRQLDRKRSGRAAADALFRS